MSKYIVVFLVAFLFTDSLFAQASCYLNNIDYHEEFYDNPTYFVYTDKEDERLEIIDEVWNITEAKFLSWEEFKSKALNLKKTDHFYYVNLDGEFWFPNQSKSGVSSLCVTVGTYMLTKSFKTMDR